MRYCPITLDKARNLKYGMRALDRIEKKLKKKITSIDLNDLSIEETAVVIWAGLVHEDRTLTPENVMDLVDEHSTMPEVTEHVANALNEAFGSTEDGKENVEKNV